MLLIFFWILIHCLSTALSIVLLGDRSLISGNLFNLENLFRLLFNWKFMLAMLCAILARISFIMLNNSLLKVSRLANVSTTVTTFVSLLSLIFILLANYLFLNEKLSIQQAFGASIVLAGVAIMVK